MAFLAMKLEVILDTCRRLEERASSLYRSYAAASRHDPAMCALWTGLAREEEAHARSIALAGAHLEPTASWRTSVDGWEEALADVERQLADAETLGADAPTDRKLSAALELEMTELEALRHVVLAACDQPDVGSPDEHALRLADVAERLSDDSQVRLQAALLRARARLKNIA
jgi:rubrerythrin